MKKILSAMVVAFFLLAVPAVAGIDEGNGEIGFNYGNTNYDSETNVDSSTDLSLRGGYFMTRMFEIEGQFINTDADIEGSSADAEMNLLMVNGVFNFHPRDNIVPYFMVGLGRADMETGGASDDSMAYQFGGGTRWFFGKAQRAALRFDLALVNEDTGTTGNKTHTSVAAGFSWRLGN